MDQEANARLNAGCDRVVNVPMRELTLGEIIDFKIKEAEERLHELKLMKNSLPSAPPHAVTKILGRLISSL